MKPGGDGFFVRKAIASLSIVEHTLYAFVVNQEQQENVKVVAKLLQNTKFTKNTKEQLIENKNNFLNHFFVLSVFFLVISNVNSNKYGKI